MKSLELVSKNRIGKKAEDFTLTFKDQSCINLHELIREYLVLYFNNPEFKDCSRIKEKLSDSEIFKQCKRIRIVSVFPEEDIQNWKNEDYPRIWINGYNKDILLNNTYDLKTYPILYLLDKDKNILLKDVSVEEIEKYLQPYF